MITCSNMDGLYFYGQPCVQGQFLDEWMANVGPNRGRTFRGAINRFAAMLIDEARTLTGCSYAELDALLDLPEGQCYRYSLYPRTKKTRSPQAASVQNLENRVARLLKRRAHTVLVQNNKAAHPCGDETSGAPGDQASLGEITGSDFQLVYEHDWPTFRRLKDKAVMSHYLWQWGILWDRGAVPLPWSRELFNLPADMPVELFLPSLTTAHIHLRAAMMKSSAAGNLPEMPSYDQLLEEARRHGFPC